MSFLSSVGKIAGIVAAPFTGGSSLLATGLSAGASLAGGLMQNNSAKSIASSNNATAIELANTAHQREVKDLLAAGLNPILSAGGAGANVPSMQQPQLTNIGDAVANSARSAAIAKAQIDNLHKTNANIEADTAMKGVQATESIARTYQTDAQTQVAGEQIKLPRAQTLGAINSARSAAVQADADEATGAYLRSLGNNANTARTPLTPRRKNSSLIIRTWIIQQVHGYLGVTLSVGDTMTKIMHRVIKIVIISTDN